MVKSRKAEDVFVVDPSQFLVIDGNAAVLTLRPDEEPKAFRISVEARERRVYRIHFSVRYDAAGSKESSSGSFLLSG
jgi:uncharacterized protein (DUF2461 family)